MSFTLLPFRPSVPKIRIIAIPALFGDPRETWLKRTDDNFSSAFWDIQSDEGDVFLYSFLKNVPATVTPRKNDVRRYQGAQNHSICQIENHAVEFLVALERDIPPGAPIHFAAFSTGGIMLKIALVLAESFLESKELIKCIHSVAFFGVPHHGSQTAAVVDKRRLREALHIVGGLNDQELETVRALFAPGNVDLEHINRDFLSCYGSLRKIWNFVEKKDTDFAISSPPSRRMSQASQERQHSGRLLDKRSAGFSTAPNKLLFNECIVVLNTQHGGLPHFRDSETREECKYYIRQLQAFILEFSVKVDVHSFMSEKTNKSPIHVMPTVAQLLREGPLHCLEDLAQGQETASPRTSTFTRHLRWIHVPCNQMSWVNQVLYAVVRESTPAKDPEALESRLKGLLDWEWWESKQYVPPHGLPHACSMEPYCRVFPHEKAAKYFKHLQLVKAQSGFEDCVQLVLYLPYLHWSPIENLQDRNAIINRVRGDLKKPPDQGSAIIARDSNLSRATQSASHQEAGSKKNPEPNHREIDEKSYHELSQRQQILYRLLSPIGNGAGRALHPRRSLDQFGHPFLEDMSTNDEDQVLYKSVKKSRELHSQCLPAAGQQGRNQIDPVLMVDQLWCWVVDKDTVVSFFSGNDSVLEDLQPLKPRDQESLQKNEEADPADVRRHVFERLTNHPRIPTECKTPFDLAMVILLSSVSSLLGGSVRSQEFSQTTELHVVGRFEEYIGHWHTSEVDKCRKFENEHKEGKLTKLKIDDTLETFGYIELHDAKDELRMLLDLVDQQQTVLKRLADYYKCMRRLDQQLPVRHRLLTMTQRRIEHFGQNFKRLVEASDAARESYKSLFDMKQVQANLNEALLAKESNDTLMLFTIVTVIFSPLSFFTSVFGISAFEWNVNGDYPRLWFAVVCIFSLSAAVVFGTLVYAFTKVPTKIAEGRRKFISRWKLALGGGKNGDGVVAEIGEGEGGKEIKY